MPMEVHVITSLLEILINTVPADRNQIIDGAVTKKSAGYKK